MKKILFFLLAGLTVLSSSVKADIQFDDIGATNINSLKEDDTRGPFKVEITFDGVGKQKIQNCHHHIQYATGEAELSMVFYHNPCYEEGASIGVSYNRTIIDWEKSHILKEDFFDDICLTLGFSSQRLCDWLWQMQVTANFDNIEHWDFSDYMNYDMLLWGRYEYSKTIGFHIGFLALTGMKIDRVYPVIGIDWKYNSHWSINAVFPLNMSIVYSFNPVWSVALAGRLFNERHRLKSNPELDKGLIQYQSAGAELGLNYNPKAWLSANIHAGYTFGGTIETSNRHHNERRRHNLDGAPYVGGEIDFSF